MSVEAQPVLFMCGPLMKNSVLRVFLWLLGISTILGNFAVLVSHIKTQLRRDVQKISACLYFNLAVADLLMGLYMILLGVADLYFGETFYLYSDEWRQSSICRGANFLVVLSCEASLLLLLVITLDRYHHIIYPFSTNHMEVRKCIYLVLAIWFLTVAISLTSSLLAGTKTDFYGLTDVCIGLPFITRPSNFSDETVSLFQETFAIEVSSASKASWYFSLTLFTGVNCVVGLVIALAYTAIFVTVKRSAKAADALPNVKKDVSMALRMSVIVGTNYMCWVPVILMGVISQLGVQIPLSLYAWTVVFVLPINSSINPFLYTFAVLISNAISDFKHVKHKQRRAKNEM